VENRSGTCELWARPIGVFWNSPDRGVFRTGLLLLFLVFLSGFSLVVREACAYPITLTFKTASGQGVPSIKIRGSRGINALTTLTSDANGNWTFDTNSLSGLDGVIVFSGVNAGMQLSPAEVRVVELVSRGIRSKVITAAPSARPSTIVSWSFYSSGTTPLTNLPVSLLNPQALSCEQRVTDESGYVAWSVPRPASKCDDLSDATGWLQIVPHEAPGIRCSSFSTYRSIGMKSCPLSGDDEVGISAATCATVTNPTPSLSSKIKISVHAAGATQGVQGVEFIGNSNFMALPSRVTDGMGNFTFSIGSVAGALASTSFDIVPIANGYEFIPRRRDSRECAFSGSNTYTCEFSAVRTFSPQGVLVLDIAQAGQPLSGVSMTQPAAGLGCMNSDVKFSDWKGRVVLPVRTRLSCNTLPGAPASSAPVAVYPALTGKRFTSASDFQYCPVTLATTASIQAFDESSGVQNYSITGRVVALDGGGFAGVPIFVNGQEAARSDADGRFDIFPIAHGTTAKVEARLSPYAFDPEFETFSNMGRTVDTTIVARAPDPLGGVIEPPRESCPVKTEYALRGRVLDRNGNPLRGARIHANNQEDPSGSTDGDGRFSVLVPFGSDTWLTVEHEGALFNPAGRSLVETICDEESLDFQQVDFESATVRGRALVADGAPLNGVPLKVTVNGFPLGYEIRSGQDGSFAFTAPLGSQIQIAPESSQYTFAPGEVGPLSVEADVSDLLFVASPIPVTFPTAFPTLAPPVSTSVPVAPPVATPVASPVAPPSQPVATVSPVPTNPGSPPHTPMPQETPTVGSTPPVAPQPRETSGVPGTITPVAPPALTGVPFPTSPPSSTLAPPAAPIATSAPVPSNQPTSPPLAPPESTVQATPTAVETATLQPTQLPISTATPAPVVAVAARCGASASEYDWVVANVGTVPLENARWRVFDASQPSVSFEGAFFNLVPGQLQEVFNTPRLGISPRFYRLMVYINDSLGRELSLAVEPWDLMRCMHGVPTPEPTATPGGPGAPPSPIQGTATPAPGVPVPPAAPTPVGAPEVPPAIPIATPLPIVTSEPLPTKAPAPTETATATPTQSYEISVETRHWRNGRNMTKELFAQLAGRGVLVIRGRAGSRFEQRVPLTDFSASTYGYTTFVPAGSYRIGFAGGVRVVSVFRKEATSFTCTVGATKGTRNRCRGVPFALQPLTSGRQTVLSRGARS
jgi:hypothetical protein